MASFVVETYVPQGDQERFSADVDGMREAAEVVVVVAGKVHHIRSYLVPGDEMGYHVVEADSAEDVVRVAKLAGIEVERIVSAIGIDPAVDQTDRRRST
jgi:hypothetical protein